MRSSKRVAQPCATSKPRRAIRCFSDCRTKRPRSSPRFIRQPRPADNRALRNKHGSKRIEEPTEVERTCYCGMARAEDAGRELTFTGWVDSRRDHGGIIFVDLRDHTGIVQIVFDPETDVAAHASAGELRSEFVIGVRGKLRRRTPETVNPRMQTGTVELVATHLEILNVSKPVPFAIDDSTSLTENVRLRYRYLDLRRPMMQRNLRVRHDVCRIARDHRNEHGFIEVETPILTRSTPEGARDYLVPSRVNPGMFFALPQSPQLFKHR